jgi:hypothetical protein
LKDTSTEPDYIVIQLLKVAAIGFFTFFLVFCICTALNPVPFGGQGILLDKKQVDNQTILMFENRNLTINNAYYEAMQIGQEYEYSGEGDRIKQIDIYVDNFL